VHFTLYNLFLNISNIIFLSIKFGRVYDYSFISFKRKYFKMQKTTCLFNSLNVRYYERKHHNNLFTC
jgi:hypothetical protein